MLKKNFHLYRKLREQRESERQSRIRLGQRLDALRPTTSTNGKSMAAEATPTIFDIVNIRLLNAKCRVPTGSENLEKVRNFI